MSERASEVLLFGAGASVEARVPGAYAMTQRILEVFRGNPSLAREARVLSFVVGGLLFQAASRGGDPFGGVNVEDLFNAVQLLAQRRTLEAAPFVGSWHAMVDEFDTREPEQVRLDRFTKGVYEGVSAAIRAALSAAPPSFSRDKVDKAFGGAMKKTIEAALAKRSVSLSSSDSVGAAMAEYVTGLAKLWSDKLGSASPRFGSEVDRAFAAAVDKRRARPGSGEVYEATNEAMIQTLASIVWIDDAARVGHLEPILALLRRQPRLVVATLNYDNAVETLAGAHGVPCGTGIERWSTAGEFPLAGDGLHLLKLHGSIDWSLDVRGGSAERPLPHSVVRQLTPEQARTGEHRPAVIFGQRNKLTAEGPYLELLRAFQRELAAATVLTVVGYSFRDAHVNEYVAQWINADGRHRLRVVDPGFPSTDVEFARHLRACGPERVSVVADGAGDGLRALYCG